jgi:hypothetical protein
MIHSIQVGCDEDGDRGVVLYEGPEFVNLSKLSDDFYKRFVVPESDYPECDAPLLPQEPRNDNSVSCCSGFFTGFEFKNYDHQSKEYKAYEKECNRIRNAWVKEREDRIKEAKKTYPGKELFDMFLSYLEIEHGFKKVPCREWNL